MVRITDQAGGLLERMQREGAFPNTLRLTSENDGLVIGTTAPSPDDQVLFHGGVEVLRLSADAARALDGCTIATQGAGEQRELAIFGPNETVQEPVG